MKVSQSARGPNAESQPHAPRPELVVRKGPAYKQGAIMQAFILDTQWKQGLVAVRSLGRAGIRVGAVDTTDDTAAFHSRWCSLAAVIPDFYGDSDAHVDVLIDLLRRHPSAVVIPTADGSIEALRRRRSDVEKYVRLAMASEDALEAAINKEQTLRIAADLGIAIPRGAPIHEMVDVSAALNEVGYPAVIKPIQSWVEHDGVGARLICEAVLNEAEAKRKVEDILAAGGSAVAQQWLPGARESINLMYADGVFWGRFAQVAHRMLPPLGGSSVLRESIPLPVDATDDAERLIRAINLEGYSEIEFRRDAAGRPVLMEINPRLSGSLEIAVRAGVDFPLLLYQWASGESLSRMDTYRIGLRVRWLGGDIRYLKETFASQGRPDVVPVARALGSFAVDFLRPTAYDYLDMHDMRPAAQATWNSLLRPVRRVTRGFWH
jgi:predicted ATP-grasp superfamily ATP-dependent carboligase